MLYDLLIAPFADFGFMRRALAGALALSFSAGPIGVFLVLRRMSLVGDAMAHAILPGAAIGYLIAGLSIWAMTLGGLIAGISVALLAGLVARNTILKEDAALAAFYLISLALGVVILSLRRSNIDLLHVLFGAVLALDDGALLLLAEIASLTLAVLAVFHRALVMECFDPGFLRSVSPWGGAAHFLFLGLLVINLVAAFHAMGTLLAVGIMMLPAIGARFWAGRLTGMMAASVLLGLASSLGGILLSYHLDLPTGPTVILLAGVFWLLSVAFGWREGLAWRFAPRRHLRG